ncbi:MAG: hypothetical protein GYA57_10935 [Myxococcales bacterium]|nr:hypothetical protein [Myxococcales bacterium]
MTEERFAEDSFEAFLLKSRLVAVAHVQLALQRRKERGDDLGVNLVEVGGLCEADLARCLSVFYQRLAVTLSDVEAASPEAVARLPRDLALRLRVCPVALTGNALRVCAARPLAADATAELERATSCAVSQAIATPIAITAGLGRHYGAPVPPRYLRLLGRDGSAPDPDRSNAAASSDGSNPAFALADTFGADAPDRAEEDVRPVAPSAGAPRTATDGAAGATAGDAELPGRRRPLRVAVAVAVFVLLAVAAVVVLLSDLGQPSPSAPSSVPPSTLPSTTPPASVAARTLDASLADTPPPAASAPGPVPAAAPSEEWVRLSLPPSCPPGTVVLYDGARATSLPVVVRRQHGSVPVTVRPPGFREEKLLVVPDRDQELAVQLLPLESVDGTPGPAAGADAPATVAAAGLDAGRTGSSSRTPRTSAGPRDRTVTAASSSADAGTTDSPGAFFTPDLPDLPDRDVVASTFESVRGGVRVCLHWPERSVTVDVAIQGSTGKPVQVGTRGDISSQTAACVEGVIRRLTFPQFRRSSVRVSFLYQY